ncbi:MAG TPA: hypothetical protein PK364_13140, partial [Synergistaceae bacterium]|nr:hypothetical protein [Synergistaceae bacterium]
LNRPGVFVRFLKKKNFVKKGPSGIFRETEKERLSFFFGRIFNKKRSLFSLAPWEPFLRLLINWILSLSIRRKVVLMKIGKPLSFTLDPFSPKEGIFFPVMSILEEEFLHPEFF